ncbi:MAG: C40 family peptidase [Lachnospiraceae bacterium]|nr:C40 family peptidase [Lachnospiraceae bacterium]
MKNRKLATAAGCLGLTVCLLSQSAFVSLAAEIGTADTGSAGISAVLSGYMNNENKESGASGETKGNSSSKTETPTTSAAGVNAITKTDSGNGGGTAPSTDNAMKSGIGALAKETEDEPVSLYENLAISKVTDYVNIRAEASTEAEILGKIYDQCAATILDTVEKEDGTWYHIKSGSVTGYMKAEFFVTGFEAEEYAKANSNMYVRATEGGLRVRSESSLRSDVLTMLYEGEKATVLEVGDEFIKVRTEGGTEGYVHGEYVEIYIECDEAISLEEEQAMIEEQQRLEREAEEARQAELARQQQAAARQQAAQQQSRPQSSGGSSGAASNPPASAPTANVGNASAARQAVVNYAMSKVGCAYVWGAEGPNAFDCSGLVKSAYAQAGVSLSHYSGSQGSAGSYRSLSEAQPGDILWKNGHVGIYIGGGQYVHASTYGVGVIVSNVSGSGFACARNVLG